MVIRNCEYCNKEFNARQADINRGWARFCSKKCKSKEQESRTGQYKAMITNSGSRSMVMPSNKKLPAIDGWKWRTKGGKQKLAPCQMRTAHLFYTLRVIWNAVMPLGMHVGGVAAIVYSFGPSYSDKYLKEAIHHIGNELLGRNDLAPDLKKQFEEMMKHFQMDNAKIEANQNQLESE